MEQEKRLGDRPAVGKRSRLFSRGRGNRDLKKRPAEDEESAGWGREEILSLIVSNLSDGICVLDRGLSISFVNPAMERAFPQGLPLVGKKCHEAFHGRQEPCSQCPALETLEKGASASRIIQKTGADGEIERWVQLWTFPDMDPHTGKIRGVIEYLRDATEEKKAEAERRKSQETALRQERDNAEKITRNSGAGVCVISRDYRIFWANEVFKENWGRTQGQSCFSALHNRSEPCPKCHLRKIFEEGKEGASFELVGPGPGGAPAWWHGIASPVLDERGQTVAATQMFFPPAGGWRAGKDLRRAKEAADPAGPGRGAGPRDCLAADLCRTIRPDQDPRPPTRTRFSSRESLRRPKARVLVVEDNRVNQKVVLGILAKNGYQANAVENGKEALEILEKIPFQIVLMDIQMPEMDGIEASRAIRQKEKGGRARVPIIALTAQDMEEDRDRCLSAGMDDYLRKPIDAKTLIEAMERALNRAERKPRNAPGAEEDKKVFDKEVLLKKIDGNRELFKEIIATLLRDNSAKIERMKEAVAAGNGQILVVHSHSVKGAAMNVGARALQAAAWEMEQAGSRGDLGLAGLLLKKMETEFNRLKAAVAAEPW